MFRRILQVMSFFTFLMLVLLAREVNQAIPEPVLENQDIYFSYVEGNRLVRDINPYERILNGNMLDNEKYATYFPLFYELSDLSQKLGLHPFLKWLSFWKTVFILFEFAVGLVLYGIFARRDLEWIGVLAAAFWFFNRWTLKVVEESNLDFIPIFFMLLALVLFPRRKWLSLYLFSMSLGFKQIAIFLAPLFVVWVWRTAPPAKRWKESIVAGLLISSVPVITGIPFLIWNAEGFVKSIAFSVTRYGSDQFGVPSVDQILGWQGPAARAIMILLILAISLAVLYGYGRKYFAAVLALSIFLDYNAVLYSQYPAWVVPVLPLIFLDFEERGNAVEGAGPTAQFEPNEMAPEP